MAKRASLAGADAQKSGFGIQEGMVRVEDARFKTIQYRKGDGSLITPMMVLQLDVCKINAKGDAETEVETKDLKVCWGSKEAEGNGLHKFRFRPGTVASVDAEEVEDAGDEENGTCEIGAEGNTFCSKDGGSPFEDEAASLFMKSLEAHGWKPEINRQAYAPNYIGAVFDVRTVLAEDLCKRLGARYNPPKDSSANAPTVWEVVKVHVRPYEKAAGGAKKGAAAQTSAKTTATSTSAGSGKTNGAANGSAEDKALAAFEAYVKTVKGKNVKRMDVQKTFGTELIGVVGMKAANEWIKANVKNDDAFGALGMAHDFEVDVDAGTVQF